MANSPQRIKDLPLATAIPEGAYMAIDSALDSEDSNTETRKYPIEELLEPVYEDIATAQATADIAQTTAQASAKTVKQSSTNENANLRVILSDSASGTPATSELKFNGNFTYNPHKGTLNVGANPENNLDVATKNYVDNTGKVFVGTSDPSNSLGNTKDIYIKYTQSETATDTVLIDNTNPVNITGNLTYFTLPSSVYNYDVINIPIGYYLEGEAVWKDVTFNTMELKNDEFITSSVLFPTAQVKLKLGALSETNPDKQLVLKVDTVSSTYTYMYRQVIGKTYAHTVDKMYTKLVDEWVEIQLGGTGNVADVYVNGVSVLDADTIAQIKSYKEVTQAEYDALPDTKLTDGVMYCIKDSEFSASNVPYDNTDSGLEADNVQDAIDEEVDALEDEVTLREELESATKVYGTPKNLPQAIATFTDGSALPMPSLKTTIVPIQDLHGYDGPWVGGGGKNKLEPKGYDGLGYNKSVGTVVTPTETTTTVTVNKNTISYTCNAWGGLAFISDKLSAGDYYVHLDISGNNRTSLYVLDENNEVTYTANFTTDNQSIASYYGVSNNAKIAIWIGNNSASNITITNPQIESGRSYTSWTPYSNICPISGWSGANVTVSPLNISQLYNGQIYGDGSWVSNTMRLTNVTSAQDNSYFLKAGTYTLDYDKLNSNAPNLLQCSALTKDGNYTIIDNFANEWNSVPFTFTLTQDGYFYFTIRKDANTNINPSDYRAKILGHTYNIPFTDSQGNPIEVFGGELDCVNGGEQPMTLGKIIVDENTDVKGYGGWRFYFDVPNFVSPANSVVANIKCDKLSTKSKNYMPQANSISAYDAGGARMIISVNDTITTVDAIKAWLANNPLEIVYELATPSTFYTQPTSPKSIVGVNNVWGDCGNIKDLKYTRNLNITINDLISRVEALEG